MEQRIIDRRTGEIDWDLLKERAKFYFSVCAIGFLFDLILFLIWWNNP